MAGVMANGNMPGVMYNVAAKADMILAKWRKYEEWPSNAAA